MATADRPDAATITAWQSLLRAHVLITQELDHRLRGTHGISLAWYDVLFHLREAGGTTSMGELNRALLIGGSRCTRRVDQMQAAGLVVRARGANDARVVNVSLTSEGRRLQRRAGATHLADLHELVGPYLSGELARTMTAALDGASLSIRPAPPSD